MARVNNPKNEWMFNEQWGVDVSVSTPHLITALVEEAVSVGTFVRLLSFEGGKAKLAEVTLAEGSPADGRSIVELGFPRDATVVAVLRAERVIVPRGDTVLRVGDEVLVLVTEESEEDVRADPDRRSRFVGELVALSAAKCRQHRSLRRPSV